IGGMHWQPVRMPSKPILAGLLAEIPEPMLKPPTLRTVLRKSGELADLDLIEESWFEDDPQVAAAVESSKGCHAAKLAKFLLQTALARRRDKWADLILRTALWMREAPVEADLCALADGEDLADIGLMRDVALRTVAVLASSGRAERAA